MLNGSVLFYYRFVSLFFLLIPLCYEQQPTDGTKWKLSVDSFFMPLSVTEELNLDEDTRT